MPRNGGIPRSVVSTFWKVLNDGAINAKPNLMPNIREPPPPTGSHSNHTTTSNKRILDQLICMIPIVKFRKPHCTSRVVVIEDLERRVSNSYDIFSSLLICIRTVFTIPNTYPHINTWHLIHGASQTSGSEDPTATDPHYNYKRTPTYSGCPATLVFRELNNITAIAKMQLRESLRQRLWHRLHP